MIIQNLHSLSYNLNEHTGQTTPWTSDWTEDIRNAEILFWKEQNCFQA